MDEQQALLKSMREFSTQTKRCIKVAVPGVIAESQLTSLGEHWDRLVNSHRDLRIAVNQLDDEQAKAITDGLPGGDLQTFLDNMEAKFSEAEEHLIGLEEVERKKKAKQEIARLERSITATNKTISSQTAQLKCLEDPESIKGLGADELDETSSRLISLFKSLQEQDDYLDKGQQEGMEEHKVVKEMQMVDQLRGQYSTCVRELEIAKHKARKTITPSPNLEPIGNSAELASQHSLQPPNDMTGKPSDYSAALGGAPKDNNTGNVPNYLSTISGSRGINGSMDGPIHSTPQRSSYRPHHYGSGLHPSGQVVGNVSTGDISMKLKYMDWPVFSGYWYDWAPWYSKWCNLVEPHGYAGRKLAEQLLNCVKGEALARIEAVIIESDESYSKMMNRLVKLYTDPSKVLGCIYREMDTFTVVHEGNHEQIVAFANNLEKIHSRLYSIDVSFPCHIDANKVDRLAGLLPGSMRDRWERKYLELDEMARLKPFAQFVGFMCMEREISDRHLPLCPKQGRGKGGFVGSLNQTHPQGSRGGGTPGSQNSVPSCWITPGHTGHWPRNCPDYMAFSPAERRKKVLSAKKCLVCLESYGRDHKCKMSVKAIEAIRCKVPTCPSRAKHRQEIGCGNPGSGGGGGTETVGFVNGQVVKYVGIYRAKVANSGNTLTVFTDDGSTINLIHEGTARSMGLKQVAQKSTLWLRTIHGVQPRHDVKVFEVPLVARHGVVTVHCFAQPDYIDTGCHKLDLDEMKRLFPKYHNIERLQRPSGPVQVLIGLENYTDLHPERHLFKSGKLAIVRGPLGDTVMGMQESVDLGSQYYIQDVHTHGSHYISTKEHQLELDKFILGEELGVKTASKCRSCTTCVQCPILGHDFSWKEQKELEIIQECLVFNEAVPRWETFLPFISPKEELPDNMSMAYATLYSTERTLDKDPAWAETYHSNIQGYISQGFARSVSLEEWQSRKDLPHWFLPHLAVLNIGSVTTPVRTVFDSGRRYKGVCLNDKLAKGPKAHTKRLLDVVIRWREEKEVLLGDIKGMFHHIGVKLEDQFMQCFLYRRDRSQVPQIYVMTVLIMGHVCSPCIATESVFKTAGRVEDSKPEVADVLNNSTYVDDVVHSVARDSILLAREVHQTLKDHGFTIKQWQFSGESCGRDEVQLFSDDPRSKGQDESRFKGHGVQNIKVLGVGWDPALDLLVFASGLNFSTKRKGKRSGPDATAETLVESIPESLTKRVCLEQVMSFYDPNGLIGPYLLCGKILLRQTWELGLQWDDPIPNDLKAAWIEFFLKAFQLEKLTFPRCTRPPVVLDPDPWLVIFEDGSKLAYGFSAYVRWRIGDSVFQSFLVLAKCRIAPLAQISIPRSELNGSLLGVRGRKCLQDACRYRFSRIIHLVDSETVLFQVTSTNKTFKMYEACRIGEIQATCEGDMRDWYWVPTDLNIADVNTRGKCPEELGPGSAWQQGPEFLSDPFEEWPIKSVEELRKQSVESQSFKVSLQEETDSSRSSRTSWLNFNHTDKARCWQHYHSSDDCLYTEEGSSFKVQVVGSDQVNNTCWLRFNRTRWDIMVRGLALVVACIRNKKWLRSVTHTVKGLREAELIIIKQVQLGLLPELDSANPGIASKSKYRRLGPVLTSDLIWCVGGRSRGATSYPVLIPTEHKCALILMERAHKKACHKGVDSTLAKFREEYYVPYGSRLAKKVRQRCTLCRLIDLHTLSQKMGSIPLHLLEEAPVYNFIQLDIFGPWKARGEVQKRTTGKIWGVLFVCLNSKAVHIEFIPGYSTEDFLMGFLRFGSLRGWPARVYSDPGSQLTAADEELKAVWAGMDQDRIQSTAASHRTEWHFSPADSPHRQGVVESLIKSVKRCVKVFSGHQHRLSWQEYATLGYECADMMNSRPLGIKSDSDDVMEVLTPNSLILGRNSSDNPGCYPDTGRTPRLSTVHKIADRFWAAWLKVCKPAMLSHRRWFDERRNLQVGDVVLVTDNSPLIKSYQLAKVTEAQADSDGMVRTVEVGYKRYKATEKGTARYTGGSTTTLRRSVQRLVLIVPVEEPVDHNNDY